MIVRLSMWPKNFTFIIPTNKPNKNGRVYDPNGIDFADQNISNFKNHPKNPIGKKTISRKQTKALWSQVSLKNSIINNEPKSQKGIN